MARTLTWRHRAAAGALVALAAVGLAACSKNADTPNGTPGTTSPGSGSLGDAPTSGAPSSGPTTSGGGGGGGGGGGTNTPLYPPDAKSYGLALFSAWTNKDYDRLATLAEQSGVQQIKDSITYSGIPDSHWTFISCHGGGSADLDDCTFRNAHGDESVVTFKKANLGHPLAVTQAMLDRTTYPSDPSAYVMELMDARDHGNVQRMVRLSSSSIQSKLKCSISGATTEVTPSSGSTIVVKFDGHGGNFGSPDYDKSYTFTVLTQPGGKANAVKSVSDINCT